MQKNIILAIVLASSLSLTACGGAASEDRQEHGDRAVKPTAQHLLDGIEGEEHTQAEDTKAIEDFKDFCKDFTVD